MPWLCAVLQLEWLNLVLENIWKRHNPPFLCDHVTKVLNRRFPILTSEHGFQPIMMILWVRKSRLLIRQLPEGEATF